MSRDWLLGRIDELNVWRSGDQRAPHKPLLLLYALGRLSRGERSPVAFRELGPELARLLEEFGPARSSYHPEYPFWRLQNDELWIVQCERPVELRASNTDPPRSELENANAMGGFPDQVQESLVADLTLLAEVAQRLLSRHFPGSIHDEILDAVGLELTGKVYRQRRDPAFRRRILTAYEYSCALCALDLRLGTVSVALEAAHIKWHQAGGPDTETNGLALCSLHHKTFDLGAYTISPEGVVCVSDQLMSDSPESERVLLRHHGGRLRSPQRPEQQPDAAFLEWHRQEVFKGSARHLEDSR